MRIGGRKRWLWRAVDQDGYVLDEIVQTRRNTKAAKRLLIRVLKKQGRRPKRIVTDKLGSYGAARRQLIPTIEHRSHKGLNNRSFRRPLTGLFLAVHWPSSADHARAAIVGHRAGGFQAVARALHAQMPARRFCGVSSMRQPHDRVTHSSKRTTSAGIRLSGRLPAGHVPLHCKNRGQRPASTLRDKPDC